MEYKNLINIKRVPKNNSIWMYSDPIEVRKQANEHGIHREIYLSTRFDKKYMLFDNNNRPVHFGQLGYVDFTKHKDLTRRKNFRVRNRHWNSTNVLSPGFLSYNLLW
jgi:hypothetical protein